ncbi:methyl-CpG binding domain protein 2 [Turdus rufiventris]|nr:methyl-CpG binding domain protein 2 [Turdus rufiventris]
MGLGHACQDSTPPPPGSRGPAGSPHFRDPRAFVPYLRMENFYWAFYNPYLYQSQHHKNKILKVTIDTPLPVDLTYDLCKRFHLVLLVREVSFPAAQVQPCSHRFTHAEQNIYLHGSAHHIYLHGSAHLQKFPDYDLLPAVLLLFKEEDFARRNVSPSGKKFRSKPQLARYLGNSVDLSSFDFRTGKMMPSKLQKNKQRLRNDALNPNKGKPDLNTTLPIRQTASIFKQPVTKVTNHPGNKVRCDPQRLSEQPRQLFWEKRLQGLSASDVSEQIIKSMELPKGLQGVGPGASTESLLSAVASALHTSSAPITGQNSAAVEKNPGIWLNTAQPLCRAFVVTDDDIRKQEERVQEVRRRLQEALTADFLSRSCESLKRTENGDGE